MSRYDAVPNSPPFQVTYRKEGITSRCIAFVGRTFEGLMTALATVCMYRTLERMILCV